MASALFVVSEEGYWGEECIEPLTTLEDAGVDVSVATPTGNEPVLDEQSADPDQVGEETAQRVREVDENHEALADPVSITEPDATEYDAIVFPSGHGTVWDVNTDQHARTLLRQAVENEGKAVTICHAAGLLAFTRDGDGGNLVEGREITGFPNEWERDIVDEADRLPDGRKLPYWVEDEVKSAGGDWDAELDQEESVTVDGDLITARGPDSSTAAARTLLDELGVEIPA